MHLRDTAMLRSCRCFVLAFFCFAVSSASIKLMDTFDNPDDMEGWECGQITSCGSFGNICGGYEVTGKGAVIEKTFTGLKAGEYLLTFDFIKIDTWDSEQATMTSNGIRCWSSEKFSASSGPSSQCGLSDREYSVPSRCSLSMSAPGDATFKLTTTLNEDSDNAAFALDNVKLVQKTFPLHHFVSFQNSDSAVYLGDRFQQRGVLHAEGAFQYLVDKGAQIDLAASTASPAKGQPAILSSTYAGLSAQYAVDGDRTTCARADPSDTNPTWHVTFQKETSIQSITLVEKKEIPLDKFQIYALSSEEHADLLAGNIALDQLNPCSNSSAFADVDGRISRSASVDSEFQIACTKSLAASVYIRIRGTPQNQQPPFALCEVSVKRESGGVKTTPNFGWTSPQTVRSASWVTYLRKHFIKPTQGATWEIEVENGEYEVTVGTGFSGASSETHYFIETLEHHEIKRSQQKYEYVQTVSKGVLVEDGALTITFLNAGTCINYVQIVPAMFSMVAQYTGTQTGGMYMDGSTPVTQENIDKSYYNPFYGPFTLGLGSTISIKADTNLKHDMIKVSFRVYAFDYWTQSRPRDITVYVDGYKVWSKSRDHSRSCKTGDWNYDFKEFYTSQLAYRDVYRYHKCYADVLLLLDHTSSSVHVEFRTGITRADITFFGIMNASVSVLPIQSSFLAGEKINFGSGSTYEVATFSPGESSIVSNGVVQHRGCVSKGVLEGTDSTNGQRLTSNVPFYVVSKAAENTPDIKPRPWITPEYAASSHTFAVPTGERHTVEVGCSSAKESKKPSFYEWDTFETPVDNWETSDYVKRTWGPPEQDCTTAYEGECSLKITSPFDTWVLGYIAEDYAKVVDSEYGPIQIAPRKRYEQYELAAYPYMCLAYKIPPDTIVHMMILSQYSATYLRDRWWDLIFATTQRGQATFADWNKDDDNSGEDPLILDNQWHYKCLNVEKQRLSRGIGHVGDGWKIKRIDFRQSYYLSERPSGSFWVDSFAITNMPLNKMNAVGAPIPTIAPSIFDSTSAINAWSQNSHPLHLQDMKKSDNIFLLGAHNMIESLDFEDGSNHGWSCSAVQSCGTFTNICGGYNKRGQGHTIQKEYSVSPGTFVISLDFVQVDRWEEEDALMEVNDQKCWGRDAIISSANADANNACGTDTEYDSKFIASCRVKVTGTKLKVTVKTTLVGSLSVKSFGIDNVMITQIPNDESDQLNGYGIVGEKSKIRWTTEVPEFTNYKRSLLVSMTNPDPHHTDCTGKPKGAHNVLIQNTDGSMLKLSTYCDGNGFMLIGKFGTSNENQGLGPCSSSTKYADTGECALDSLDIQSSDPACYLSADALNRLKWSQMRISSGDQGASARSITSTAPFEVEWCTKYSESATEANGKHIRWCYDSDSVGPSDSKCADLGSTNTNTISPHEQGEGGMWVLDDSCAANKCGFSCGYGANAESSCSTSSFQAYYWVKMSKSPSMDPKSTIQLANVKQEQGKDFAVSLWVKLKAENVSNAQCHLAPGKNINNSPCLLPHFSHDNKNFGSGTTKKSRYDFAGAHGFSVTIGDGWDNSIQSYAKGLHCAATSCDATIINLTPGKKYLFGIVQYAQLHAGDTHVFVNDKLYKTRQTATTDITVSGEAEANEAGQIKFEFLRLGSSNPHLSKISLIPEGSCTPPFGFQLFGQYAVTSVASASTKDGSWVKITRTWTAVDSLQTSIYFHYGACGEGVDLIVSDIDVRSTEVAQDILSTSPAVTSAFGLLFLSGTVHLKKTVSNNGNLFEPYASGRKGQLSSFVEWSGYTSTYQYFSATVSGNAGHNVNIEAHYQANWFRIKSVISTTNMKTSGQDAFSWVSLSQAIVSNSKGNDLNYNYIYTPSQNRYYWRRGYGGNYRYGLYPMWVSAGSKFCLVKGTVEAFRADWYTKDELDPRCYTQTPSKRCILRLPTSGAKSCIPRDGKLLFPGQLQWKTSGVELDNAGYMSMINSNFPSTNDYKQVQFTMFYSVHQGTLLNVNANGGWQIATKDTDPPASVNRPDGVPDEWRRGSWTLESYICVLNGAISASKSEPEQTIATLPPECRPPQRLVFSVRHGDGKSPGHSVTTDAQNSLARIDVTPNGEILFMKSARTKLSRNGLGTVHLDGIAFSTKSLKDQSVLPHSFSLHKPVHANYETEWTPNTFSSSYGRKFVHLNAKTNPVAIGESKYSFDIINSTLSDGMKLLTKIKISGKSCLGSCTTELYPVSNSIPNEESTFLGVAIPQVWSVSLWLQPPTSTNNLHESAALISSSEDGTDHVSVEPSSGRLGVSVGRTGVSKAEGGLSCKLGFRSSSISLADEYLFPKRRWTNLIIAAKEGVTTFYVNGRKEGSVQCQILAPMSYLGKKYGMLTNFQMFFSMWINNEVAVVMSSKGVEGCSRGCLSRPCSFSTLYVGDEVKGRETIRVYPGTLAAFSEIHTSDLKGSVGQVRSDEDMPLLERRKIFASVSHKELSIDEEVEICRHSSRTLFPPTNTLFGPLGSMVLVSPASDNGVMIIKAFDDENEKPFFEATMAYGHYTKILTGKSNGKVMVLESSTPFIATAFEIKGDFNCNSTSLNLIHPQLIGRKFLLPNEGKEKALLALRSKRDDSQSSCGTASKFMFVDKSTFLNGEIIPLHNLDIVTARQEFYMYEYSANNALKLKARVPFESDLKEKEVAFLAVEKTKKPPAPKWLAERVKVHGGGLIEIYWEFPGYHFSSPPRGISSYRLEVKLWSDDDGLFSEESYFIDVADRSEEFQNDETSIYCKIQHHCSVISRFSDGSRLQYSKTYQFRIQTLSGSGSQAKIGEYSSWIEQKMQSPSKPSPPLNVKVRATTGGAIYVNWNEPLNAGGIGLTYYRLRAQDVFGKVITRVFKSTADGEVALFRRIDSDKNGLLSMEETTNEFLVEINVLRTESQGFTLPPFPDVGSFFSQYDLDNDGHIVFSEFLKPYDFPVVNLLPFTLYTVDIAVENLASWCEGLGELSQNVTAATTKVTESDAVAKVNAEASSSGGIAISWSKPLDEGGYPITGYSIGYRYIYGRENGAFVDFCDEQDSKLFYGDGHGTQRFCYADVKSFQMTRDVVGNTAEWTIAAWIKLGKQSGTMENIFSISLDDNTFTLKLQFSFDAINGHQVTSRCGKGAVESIMSSLPENLWAHVAATYSSSALKLYINSELVASMSASLACDCTDISANTFSILGSSTIELENSFVSEMRMLKSVANQQIINRMMQARGVESIVFHDSRETTRKIVGLHYNSEYDFDVIPITYSRLPNQYGLFMGSSSEMVVSKLNFDSTLSNKTFAIEAWIQIEKSSSQVRLFSLETNVPSETLKLSLGVDFKTLILEQGGQDETIQVISTKVQLKEWTHLYVGFGQNNTITAYVNGYLQTDIYNRQVNVYSWRTMRVQPQFETTSFGIDYIRLYKGHLADVGIVRSVMYNSLYKTENEVLSSQIPDVCFEVTFDGLLWEVSLNEESNKFASGVEISHSNLKKRNSFRGLSRPVSRSVAQRTKSQPGNLFQPLAPTVISAPFQNAIKLSWRKSQVDFGGSDTMTKNTKINVLNQMSPLQSELKREIKGGPVPAIRNTQFDVEEGTWKFWHTNSLLSASGVEIKAREVKVSTGYLYQNIDFQFWSDKKYQIAFRVKGKYIVSVYTGNELIRSIEYSNTYEPSASTTKRSFGYNVPPDHVHETKLVLDTYILPILSSGVSLQLRLGTAVEGETVTYYSVSAHAEPASAVFLSLLGQTDYKFSLQIETSPVWKSPTSTGTKYRSGPPAPPSAPTNFKLHYNNREVYPDSVESYLTFGFNSPKDFGGAPLINCALVQDGKVLVNSSIIPNTNPFPMFIKIRVKAGQTNLYSAFCQHDLQQQGEQAATLSVKADPYCVDSGPFEVIGDLCEQINPCSLSHNCTNERNCPGGSFSIDNDENEIYRGKFKRLSVCPPLDPSPNLGDLGIAVALATENYSFEDAFNLLDGSANGMKSGGGDTLVLWSSTYALGGSGEFVVPSPRAGSAGFRILGLGGSYVSAIQANPGNRIMTVPANAVATFEDVTLLSGNASSGDGGAVNIINGGELTFLNCAINGSSAGRHGGGVFVGPGSAFLSLNSVFSFNRATENGGGIFCAGKCTIAGHGIKNNKAFGGGGGLFISSTGSLSTNGSLTVELNDATYGGGIAVEGDFNGQAHDVSLQANTAHFGGGLFIENGGLYANANFNVRNNRAGGSSVFGNLPSKFQHLGQKLKESGGGGGVFFFISGALKESKVSSVFVSSNHADGVGGGIAVARSNNAGKSSFTVNSGAKIEKNYAGSDGGGFYADTNIQLVWNEAEASENIAQQNGGGIALSNGSLFFGASGGGVVARNMAYKIGGGVFASSSQLITRQGKIVENYASMGGGVGAEDAVLKNTDNTSSAIIAMNVAGAGGGLALKNVNLEVLYLQVKGNTALSYGIEKSDLSGLPQLVFGDKNSSIVPGNNTWSKAAKSNYKNVFVRAASPPGADSTLQYDYFKTVQKSRTSASIGGLGGGIYATGHLHWLLSNSSDDLIIESNRAHFGGGVYINSPSNGSHIASLAIRKNNATYIKNVDQSASSDIPEGGGLFLSGAEKILFQRLNVEENRLEDPQEGANELDLAINGGGMAMDMSSNVQLEQSTFKQNIGTKGGALHVSSSKSLRITESNFVLSMAKNSSTGRITSLGGAVYLTKESEATLESTSMDACETDGHGGAIAMDSKSTLSILTSTFSERNKAHANGGAIFVTKESSLRVAQCTFGETSTTTEQTVALPSEQTSDNSKEGGAIFIHNSAVDVTASTFAGLRSSVSGGAIATTGKKGYTSFINATIFNCASKQGGAFVTSANHKNTLHNISVQSCGAKSGGALAVLTGSQVILTASKFKSNTAYSNPGENQFGYGGAIYMLESNLSMISVDIEQSSSSYGGAIFSEQSNVTVFGGIMQMNVASHKIHGPKRSVGGVGLFYGGNLKISSLVVKNNTAEYGGGLGLAHNVNASITNVEFSSNFAKEGGSGGAMLISEANVFVSSCSVHDNVVAAGGVGGAFVFYAKDYSNKILTPPVAVEPLKTPSSSAQSRRLTDKYGIQISHRCIVHNVSIIRNTVLDSSYDSSGGGISVFGYSKALISIEDSFFGDNTAKEGGGVSVFNGGRLYLYQCNFLNHRAYLSGGIALVDGLGSHLHVSKSTFRNSSALQRGGAVAVRDSGIVHMNGTEIRHSFSRVGGAFYIDEKASVHMQNSRVRVASCISHVDKCKGGGAYLSAESSLFMQNATIEMAGDLYTTHGGGIFAAQHSHVHLINSKIHGCTANFAGGIFIESQSSCSIMNNTVISSNNAMLYNGAGMYIKDSKKILIRESLFEQNIAATMGGGIYFHVDAYADIQDTTFKSNSASQGGGCFFGRHSNGLLRDSLFVQNEAIQSGGALTLSRNRNEVLLMRTTFLSNSVEDDMGWGGAVEVNRAKGLFIDSTFSNNSANGGGGMLVKGNNSNVTLNSCDFQGNFGKGSFSVGGAVHVYNNAFLYLLGATKIEYNSAHNGGGAFVGEHGTIRVTQEGSTRVSFNKNRARNHGGAIFFDGKESQGQIVGATLSGNVAVYGGGGIYMSHVACINDKDSEIIEQCIFVSNTAFKENKALMGAGIWWFYVAEQPLFRCSNCAFESNNNHQISTQSVGINSGWLPPQNDTVKSGVPFYDIYEKGPKPHLRVVDLYDNQNLMDEQTLCFLRSNDFSSIAPLSAISKEGKIDLEGGLPGDKIYLRVTGDIGTRANLTFLCETKEGKSLPLFAWVIEIGPCDPGEEMGSNDKCVRCPQNFYSPNGKFCVECPDGGYCRKRFPEYSNPDTGEKIPAFTTGSAVPSVLPGYWQGPPSKQLVTRVPKDEGYCDWDPDACRNFPGCGNGMCEPTSQNPLVCSNVRIKRLHKNHLFNCLFNRHMYVCPSDEISCIGVGDEKNPCANGQPGNKGTCGTAANPCSSGYQQDSYKCARCQKNWYKAGDGTCKLCVGAESQELTVILYTIMAAMAAIAFSFVLALYLRDDSGASFFQKIPVIKKLPCLKQLRQKSTTKIHAQESLENDDVLSRAQNSQLGIKFRPEKFKIILTYVQILSLFRSNYAIKWPGLVKSMFRLLASFNFDLIELAALDCIYRSNYFFSLVVICVMPIASGVVLLFVKRLGYYRYKRRLRKTPRLCIKSGKPIHAWMDATQYHDLRVRTTTAALQAAGMAEVTKSDLIAELRESAPLLPPSSSILHELGGSSALNVEEGKAVVIKNVLIFKKRVMTRINHLFYNNKCARLFFWLLLLSYPSVSLRVTRFFSCEQIGDHWVLSYDLFTTCYDREYFSYSPFAVIGIFAYVIGIPALFFTILWRAREDGVAWKLRMCRVNKDVEKQLVKEAEIDAKLMMEPWMEPQNAKETSQVVKLYLRRRNFRSHRTYNRLGFIYYAYNENVWWYECVELSRKVCLNGLVALITPGEASQIVVGIFICCFYYIFVMVVQPYKSRSDHLLSASTHASLMFTLMSGLAINLEVHFLGHRTFPTIEERHMYEMLCIEVAVVGQVALVAIQFVVGVIFENTCSKEMRHMANLNEQRNRARKKTAAKTKKTFKKMLRLSSMGSKKQLSTFGNAQKALPVERARVVPLIKPSTDASSEKTTDASAPPISQTRPANTVTSSTPGEGVKNTEDSTKPSKRKGLHRKTTYIL